MPSCFGNLATLFCCPCCMSLVNWSLVLDSADGGDGFSEFTPASTLTAPASVFVFVTVSRATCVAVGGLGVAVGGLGVVFDAAMLVLGVGLNLPKHKRHQASTSLAGG